MTARSSCGNCVRISVSSATATFLAARKQPRRSIERLMSTSSTVEVRVSCSVRKTSKSSGARRTAGRPRAAPGAFSGAAQRVLDRAAEVEMERVAELVRLGRLLALAAPPGPVDPVAAERVARQPREQVVEDLLADPPAARAASARGARRGGRGSRPPRAGGRARRARRGRARRRRRAARGRRRDRSPPRSPGLSTSASESSSASSAWSRPICSSAGLEAERLLAA